MAEARTRNMDGTPVVFHHGVADHVEFDTDEGRWVLHVVDEAGFLHVFDVHGITSALLPLVKPLEDYWNEGLAAARSYVPPPTRDDLDAYDIGDPKRISLERDLG